MRLGRKARRQAEAKDDRLGLDLRVVGIAHDLYDYGLGRRHGGAIAGDLRGDHFALVRPRYALFQRNGAANSGIHRDQIRLAVDFAIGAEQPLLAVLQDLRDMRFGAAAESCGRGAP